MTILCALEKDDERLRVINHHLKAKSESQRDFLAVSQESSSIARNTLRPGPRTHNEKWSSRGGGTMLESLLSQVMALTEMEKADWADTLEQS